MTREADVVRSLVEIADTLVDDYDVVELLTGRGPVRRSARRLRRRVMLASPASSLGLVASSSKAMRLLELFELQEQEGSCLDAFRTGERVGHENPGCRVRPLAVVFRRCPPGRLPVGVSPMSPGPPSTAPSIRGPGPPYNTGSMFPRRWRVRPAEWRAAVVIGHDHRAGVRLELDERVPERGGRGVLTAHGDHRRPDATASAGTVITVVSAKDA